MKVQINDKLYEFNILTFRLPPHIRSNHIHFFRHNKMKDQTYLRLFVSVATILCLISCSIKGKVNEQKDIFDEMQPGYNLMAFLAEIPKKDMASVSIYLDVKFDSIGFQKVENLPLIIGSDTIPRPKGSFMWNNPDNGITVFINELENKNNANSQWSEVSEHIGRYSGTTMGGGGIYYLKNDPEQTTSLNATFKAGKKIIQLHAPLDFILTDVFELDEDQRKEVLTANTSMTETLDFLVDILVSEKNRIYRPLNGRSLTENERMSGFINFWTEVKYNFAFFDQVPELDWQQVLMDYIPKVKNATSNLEYYRVLQEVCAQLNDGHTNIYLPSELQMVLGTPAVTITPIDGLLYVTNIDKTLSESVPLGSQLISVDHVPVETYIQEHVRPYISSSTDHIRRNTEARKVLEGNKLESVWVELQTPEGELKQLTLSRNPSNVEWGIPRDGWELSTFKRYGDVAYISLNSFDSRKIVEEFEGYLDSIQTAEALILDLRKNGGGSSWNGYNILQHLTEKPIITSKWKTREHRPALKAWGAFIDENSEHLGSWDRETLASYKDDYWFESGPDTIAPNNDVVINLPTVVLIGNNTASAAEDFLVAADPIDNMVTMGDYSYGSTGQPMFIRLPGGGKARICTKRDTYPDGREFVGYGVKPDVLIAKTLEDILTGEDSILNMALEYLTEQFN